VGPNDLPYVEKRLVGAVWEGNGVSILFYSPAFGVLWKKKKKLVKHFKRFSEIFSPI
jgi:hypothetical protein